MTDWIVGGSAPDVSTSLQALGVESVSLQAVGAVGAVGTLQGSLDGVNWEQIGRVEVDVSGPSQVQEVAVPPVAFFRVAVADDAGGTVSVSAVLSS